MENNYRWRKLSRLNGFDYSNDNCYFVTTCVEARQPAFGTICNGQMELNAAGVIVENQLMWLQDRYEYVKIHLAVVMPDHVHAIIEIRSNGKNGIKVKSLSELMGAFKMTSSKQIRAEEFSSFAWQRSFHDRIIRNEESYDAILRYIKENPMNWENK